MEQKDRDNQLKELLATIDTEGFRIIIRWIKGKLDIYEREILKTYIPSPYYTQGMLVNDENWTWYMRGKILGLKYVLRTLQITTFFTRHLTKRQNFKRIQLLRGFCTGIAEFLSYLKQTVEKIREWRKK